MSKDYIKDRLENQIDWYDRKSLFNQKRYKSGQLFKIILAVSIPVLTLFSDFHFTVKYIIAVVAAIIAFLEGTAKLYNYKDLYVKYRATCEFLKREKLFFENQVAPYDKEEPLKKLILRCEKIMKDENEAWEDMAESEDS
ncbi:MAG: DUF4231 domain-containing protein [Bacteroidota bacterium]